ncbi:MAG: hypothetical protein M3Y59_11050 [Myxococcota bacterium]|nr:hypothetical protein [Myxococcota bacterium]
MAHGTGADGEQKPKEDCPSPSETVPQSEPAAAPADDEQASPIKSGPHPLKGRATTLDRAKMLPAQPVRSRNTVTFNPLALFQSQLALEYERALNDWFTVYVSPQPTLLLTAGRLEVGLLAEAGVRLVLIGKPPGGFYLGPLVAVAMSRETASGVSTLSVAVPARPTRSRCRRCRGSRWESPSSGFAP